MATGAVATLNRVTWGHAKQVSFGHIDVDYYSGLPGFEDSSTLAGIGLEAALFMIPTERVVQAGMYGVRSLSVAHFGVDAIEASRPVFELVGSVGSSAAAKVGTRAAASAAARAAARTAGSGAVHGGVGLAGA